MSSTSTIALGSTHHNAPPPNHHSMEYISSFQLSNQTNHLRQLQQMGSHDDAMGNASAANANWEGSNSSRNFQHQEENDATAAHQNPPSQILTTQERLNFKNQIRKLLLLEERQRQASNNGGMQADGNDSINEDMSIREKNVKILLQLMKSIQSEPTLIIKKPSPVKRLRDLGKSSDGREAEREAAGAAANAEEGALQEASSTLHQQAQQANTAQKSLNNARSTPQSPLIAASRHHHSSSHSHRTHAEDYTHNRDTKHHMNPSHSNDSYSNNSLLSESASPASSLNGDEDHHDTKGASLPEEQQHSTTGTLHHHQHQSEQPHDDQDTPDQSRNASFNSRQQQQEDEQSLSPVTNSQFPQHTSQNREDAPPIHSSSSTSNTFTMSLFSTSKKESTHAATSASNTHHSSSNYNSSSQQNSATTNTQAPQDFHNNPSFQTEVHPISLISANHDSVREDPSSYSNRTNPYRHHHHLRTSSSASDASTGSSTSTTTLLQAANSDRARELKALYGIIEDCNDKYQRKHRELMHSLSSFSRKKMSLKQAINEI